MTIDHWRPWIDLALTSKSQKRQKIFFETSSSKPTYKIRTKSAVCGSLIPHLKIRTYSTVHPFLETRTKSVVRESLQPPPSKYFDRYGGSCIPGPWISHLKKNLNPRDFTGGERMTHYLSFDRYESFHFHYSQIIINMSHIIWLFVISPMEMAILHVKLIWLSVATMTTFIYWSWI